MKKVILIHNQLRSTPKIAAPFQIEWLPYKGKFQDEDLHDFVADTLSKMPQEDVLGIAIELSLGQDEVINQAYPAFRLAMHIRFSPELQAGRFLPIVIMGVGQTYMDILEGQREKTALITLTPGTRYAHDWQSTLSAFKELAPIQSGIFQKAVLDQLVLERPTQFLSNHSITNQWGAFRLDQAARTKALDASKQSIFKGLYFKYLIAQSLASTVNVELGQKTGTGPVSSIEGAEKRILLIDDEADKGWAEVLTAMLHAHTFESLGKSASEDTSAYLSRIQEKLAEDWDLILLDLRLTANDHEPASSTYSGIQILKQIKAQNPATSLIMFTASTQATNYETLMDEGADGYYIKEGLEHIGDPDFSRQNYARLVEAVNHCLHKTEILKPFWTQVQRIESGLDPSLIQNPKIKARITERLRMFFGLLKKSFELTSYDQETFFYSAQELAFMTLWSVLNEAQEDYYDKKRQSFPIYDPRNNHTFSSHPGGQTSLFDNQMNWAIRTTRGTAKEELYISMLPELDSKTGYPLKAKNPDFYKIEQHSEIGIAYGRNAKKKSTFNGFSIGGYEKRGKWDERISLQIAFLILKMPELQKGIDFYCQEKNILHGVWESAFLKKLYDLNGLRNKLYLTHGDTDPSFFAKTEKEKRESGDISIRVRHEIKDLFELVMFVLTGKVDLIQF